jgi:hypothetical protein
MSHQKTPPAESWKMGENGSAASLRWPTQKKFLRISTYFLLIVLCLLPTDSQQDSCTGNSFTGSDFAALKLARRNTLTNTVHTRTANDDAHL